MFLEVSLCSVFTLVTVLALCSCWKRKRQKDDWLGLDGMVTQKNPDENVNHLPSAAALKQTVLDNPVTTVVTNDECDYSKRPAVVSNTRRSLPDIPSEGRDGAWEPSGDNLSELYATVEPYHNAVKRHRLPNGIESRPSVSQHSSISQADDAFAPYASVNYDKLNKLEHPYAIVKPPGTFENNETLEEPTVRTSLLSEVPSAPSTSSEPHPPPRSRRSSSQSSLVVDINAATAVAGGIAASQELPYMTPPIGPPSQANFSGDSQDSSKGYTSISVREPLANIIAQTKLMNKNKTKRALDPHYSTVSDDSDEMYTTIPDSNNQEYTSGSETYAQIQPLALTVAIDVNPVPSSVTASTVLEAVEVAPVDEFAPQPPSVDSLKNMTGSHSRQASSSSSILNLGSPKPEKRQANSPLPPPPSATSPDFLNVDKPKNIDDMYAKVQKNKRKVEELAIDHSPSPPDDKPEQKTHNYETLKKSPRKNSDPGYEKLKIKDESEPGYARIRDDLNYEQLKNGYSIVNKVKPCEEPNYESMPSSKSGSETDPNYESVNQNDPNYESVKYLDVNFEPTNLDSTSSKNCESSHNSDDPPYEKFNDSKTDSESSGYERIDLLNEGTANDYETVRNEIEDDEVIVQV